MIPFYLTSLHFTLIGKMYYLKTATAVTATAIANNIVADNNNDDDGRWYGTELSSVVK